MPVAYFNRRGFPAGKRIPDEPPLFFQSLIGIRKRRPKKCAGGTFFDVSTHWNRAQRGNNDSDLRAGFPAGKRIPDEPPLCF